MALFESLFGQTEAFMSAVVSMEKSAQEKLQDMLEMYVYFAEAEEFKKITPLLIDVWAQNWQDPDVNEVAVALYNRFREPLIQVIEVGIAGGEFKPVNAGALASVIFATYDGLMVQAMIDESMVDWSAVNETVKNTLIAGLLAD